MVYYTLLGVGRTLTRAVRAVLGFCPFLRFELVKRRGFFTAGVPFAFSLCVFSHSPHSPSEASIIAIFCPLLFDPVVLCRRTYFIHPGGTPFSTLVGLACAIVGDYLWLQLLADPVKIGLFPSGFGPLSAFVGRWEAASRKTVGMKCRWLKPLVETGTELTCFECEVCPGEEWKPFRGLFVALNATHVYIHSVESFGF